MSNEANTCRKYVEPRLKDAGWDTEPHGYYEQYYFTDGKNLLKIGQPSPEWWLEDTGKRANILKKATKMHEVFGLKR